MTDQTDSRDNDEAPGLPPPGQTESTPPADTPAPVPLWNNLITIGGMLTAGMSFLLLVTFGAFHVVTPASNPYVDVVGYVILPAGVLFGLGLIPLGILFKSWRLHRRNPDQRVEFHLPRIDLNDPRQRRTAKLVLLVSVVLLPAVAITGYHGYHYTDSADFCAKACHSVMEPQATAYEHSSHARVACAECHIGTGASWFVKSKLSGTRQVLAVWRNSYPRPIPPAITELRPARDTCEHCHWPKKFFGAQLKEIVRYASDETNTRREIDILLKTGGGDESIGRAEGIHMHMALSGQVDYIATDEYLQQIPWVKSTDAAGRETIYRADGRPSSDPEPRGQVRQLDCMDCHNRPAHKFRSPQDAVDLFLSGDKLDPTLPYIKREAVAALARPYPDIETAHAQIGAALAEFYQRHYPEVWRRRRAAVHHAVDQVREIYTRNFFPAMKVDWRTYPDNIGHKTSPGCFRCHNDQHVSQVGKTLALDCDTCHTFLNRVDTDNGDELIQHGRFQHSIKLEGRHAELLCHQCHDGGAAPQRTCEGCHADTAAFRAGTLEAFAAFELDADPMADSVACDNCHDLSEPTDLETLNATCMDCHDDEEERFGPMLAEWRAEVDQLLAAAENAADAGGNRTLELLRTAGPMHNIEATRKILRRIIGPSDVTADGEP